MEEEKRNNRKTSKKTAKQIQSMILNFEYPSINLQLQDKYNPQVTKKNPTNASPITAHDT